MDKSTEVKHATLSEIFHGRDPETTHHILPMKFIDENEEPQTTLPPADRGFLAWRFLVVIFLADALLWGMQIIVNCRLI